MKLDTLKPDEVCAWIKKRIRELFGDFAENKSNVWAANGFYYIYLYRGKVHNSIRFTEFTLRRKSLPKLFKQLKKDR